LTPRQHNAHRNVQLVTVQSWTTASVGTDGVGGPVGVDQHKDKLVVSLMVALQGVATRFASGATCASWLLAVPSPALTSHQVRDFRIAAMTNFRLRTLGTDQLKVLAYDNSPFVDSAPYLTLHIVLREAVPGNPVSERHGAQTSGIVF
jgi:hypothetical protein